MVTRQPIDACQIGFGDAESCRCMSAPCSLGGQQTLAHSREAALWGRAGAGRGGIQPRAVRRPALVAV